MADSFNPYREWLGLGEDCTQPNYYQLLGLDAGESDREKIATASDRAATRIRGFRPGSRAAEWSKLLDEVRAAKTCLTDAKSKRDYDRKLATSGVTRTNPKKERLAPDVAKADRLQTSSYGSIAAYVAATASATSAKPPAAAPSAASESVPDLPPGAMALPPGAGYGQAPGYGQSPSYGQAPAYAVPGYPSAGGISQPTTMPAPGSAWPAAPAAAASYGQSYQQPYGSALAAMTGYPQAAPAAYPQSTYPQAGYPANDPMAPVAGYGAAMPGYAPASGGMMPAAPATGYAPYGQPAPYPGSYPAAPLPPAVPPPGMAGAGDPLAIDLAGRGKKLDLGALGGGEATSGAPLAVPLGPMAAPYGGAAAPYGSLAGPMASALGPMSPMAPLGSPMSPMSPMAPAYPQVAPHLPAPQPMPGPGGFEMPAAGGRSSAAPAAAAIAARRKSDMQRNVLLLAAGSVAIILLAAGGAYVAMSGNGDDTLTVKNDSPPVTPAGSPNKPGDGVKPADGTKPTDATKPIVEVQPVPMPEPTKPAPMPVPMPEMPAPMPELPKPEPPKPEPVPEPAKPVPMPEPPKPEPPKPEPPKPEPPPVPKPTKEQLQELGEALTTAKTALGELQFDRAETNIARAELLAKLPEHQEMVARLKEVANYCKQFRQAVGQAVLEFQIGDEIRVGSSTVLAVVETSPDRIVVKITGMNRTYRLDDLPVGLALAICEYKLPAADPVNKVIRGAYLAVDKRKDPDTLAKAKSLWEEAIASGIDANPLLPFLTDDYDLAKGM